MTSTTETRRQANMDALSTPFSAVFTSVGVLQNEKAMKLAFYNTAALVFVALSGCTAVAVYYVMEPFLRPLLWASLCGAFLYPFKWKLTQMVRGFLRSLRESNTPLVIGTTMVPFRLANRFSDFIGSFVVYRIRIFILAGVMSAICFVLYIIQPFNEIFWILKGCGVVVNLLLDIFHNPYLVRDQAHFFETVIDFKVKVSFSMWRCVSCVRSKSKFLSLGLWSQYKCLQQKQQNRKF